MGETRTVRVRDTVYEIEYRQQPAGVLRPFVRSMTGPDGTTLVQMDPELQMPFEQASLPDFGGAPSLAFTGRQSYSARPVLPLKMRLLL